MVKVVVIFGANGSGKSTLRRSLAEALNYQHIGAEDYYFDPSDDFHANPHSRESFISLMNSDIDKHGSFVISSVIGDYGDRITSSYILAVLLQAPKEIRIDRIRKRAFDMHGKRTLPGGDLYDDSEKFINFARNRDLSIIDDWSKTLICPTIRLDATRPIMLSVSEVIDFLHTHKMIQISKSVNVNEVSVT